ncbi:MAG TPA: AraC family transcriptional regulator [Opitutus sp.]|nr:AraC family transcriptional regulator [Opitutus sp.]
MSPPLRHVSSGLSADDPRLTRLLTASRLIEESPGRAATLAHLARVAAMSPYHFLRLFRATFGQTPRQRAIEVRLERAKQLLADTTLSITAICDAVGYESLGSFSALFARHVGMTPRLYRTRRRRYWTMGLEFPPLFIPGCFLTAMRPGAESQFSRSIGVGACASLTELPTTPLP